MRPSTDHPIAIARNPARVMVTSGGRVIADTREALTLREAAYPAVAGINGYLAFYPDRIDIAEDQPAGWFQRAVR